MLVLGLAAATMAAAPASAASPNGQTVTETQNVHGVFLEPEATNPCTGNTFNGGAGIQFTGNLVNHVTFFTNSDEFWATITDTGKIVGTDDGTGAPYTGHATAWGNFNLNEKNSNTTFTLTIRVSAADGSSVVGHEVTHFALNANGEIVVNFDKPSFTCS